MDDNRTSGQWVATASAVRAGGFIVAQCFGDFRKNGSKCVEEQDANAAFIVRACNAHDALVAVLTKIDAGWTAIAGPPDKAYESLSPKTADIWREIRAALTLARGKA